MTSARKTVVREKVRIPVLRTGRRRGDFFAAWAAILLVAGCKTGRDYPDPSGPRYGGRAEAVYSPIRGDTLRIVSFNIEFARQMRGAIALLRNHPRLRDADIILLQEMDARGAKMTADSLRMSFVYHPAIFHRISRKDFGNAVLSRWPIVEEAKLILPSRSRYAKTQRVATAATVRVRGRMLRVYSTHLGTPADLGHAGRVAQIQFILSDAMRYPHVIIGGDMNSTNIGLVARDAGYVWPTDTIPRSANFARLDHIYMKGLVPAGSPAAGTVTTAPLVSDHRPIWVSALPSP